MWICPCEVTHAILSCFKGHSPADGHSLFIETAAQQAARHGDQAEFLRKGQMSRQTQEH